MDDRLTNSYWDIRDQADALDATVARLRSDPPPRSEGAWLFIGSGASFHAATLAASWVRALGIHAAAATPASEAWMSPERWVDGDTTVVALSRTGTTVETVEAVRAARGLGARTVGISCTPDTPLLQDCDHPVILDGVRERGRVMTRSFASLALAAQWTAAAGLDRDDALDALGRVPAAVAARADAYDGLAREAAARRSEHCVFLGSEPHVGICNQARLQLLETARVAAEAYPVLEYRHGPLAGLTPSTEIVLISTPRSLAADLLIEADVEALGGRLTVCGAPAVLESYGKAVRRVPLPDDLPAAVQGNVALPFLQLFAYHLTREHGRDPEAVHNLDQRTDPHVNPHAVDPGLFVAARDAASVSGRA